MDGTAGKISPLIGYANSTLFTSHQLHETEMRSSKCPFILRTVLSPPRLKCTASACPDSYNAGIYVCNDSILFIRFRVRMLSDILQRLHRRMEYCVSQPASCYRYFKKTLFGATPSSPQQQKLVAAWFPGVASAAP